MSAKLKFRSVRIALFCIGVAVTINDASAAPSAEVAKKCAALTAKAFPPRVAGNGEQANPNKATSAST
jgi:hypothetical protein